ncbi:ATP-binding protein [Actinokineospora pegani]|uniref:ATP-binding protein n=1 Tax=Actinokineospora pegani TaxID=2654637 RepID=UPI0012E9CFA0|nr:ATP-binding protein [Actinokineospora pegani]
MCTSEDPPDDGFDLDLKDPTPPLATVRERLSAEMNALEDQKLDDLLLICNELVTNAYEHAEGPRRIAVHCVRHRTAVLVEVRDGSPDRRLAPRRSRTDEARGRGLVLVGALAPDSWGVRTEATGKTVWAELALT